MPLPRTVWKLDLFRFMSDDFCYNAILQNIIPWSFEIRNFSKLIFLKMCSNWYSVSYDADLVLGFLSLCMTETFCLTILIFFKDFTSWFAEYNCTFKNRSTSLPKAMRRLDIWNWELFEIDFYQNAFQVILNFMQICVGFGHFNLMCVTEIFCYTLSPYTT